MSDKTKAVNLAEDEIRRLISWHGGMLGLEAPDNHIERITYLNKRLKTFKELDTEIQSKPENASGWGA